MKRFLLIFLVAAAVIPPVLAASANIMSVQVKQSEIRKSPSGLAAKVAVVQYGEALTVGETKGAWTQVTTGSGLSGWIPSTSLVKGRLTLKAGSADAQLAASSDEMTSATKGFNSKVESDFRSQHKDIDFSWVDKMEKMKVSEDKMRAFLKAGKVQTAEGGAQ